MRPRLSARMSSLARVFRSGQARWIGDNARIGSGSRIEAGAVIGEGVRMGKVCRIYPRAVLYAGTMLGNRVCGSCRRGAWRGRIWVCARRRSGAYTQFPQQGTLVIEDDVEIGANSTIDRGALEETRVRRGTKIDNLVHIGHNCDMAKTSSW